MKSGTYAGRLLEHPGFVRNVCAACSVPFWLSPSTAHRYKCCSSACGVAYRTAVRNENERACQICAVIFTPRRAQVRAGIGRFCGRACMGKWLAMNRAPGCYEKASKTMKAGFATGRIAKRVGAESPNWSGGPRAAKSRRRALMRGAEGSFDQSDIDRLFALQKGCCTVCRTKLPKGFHVDHVVPLAKGGSNWPSNLQLLCRRCNNQKHVKDPLDSMREKGFLL